MPKVPPMPSKLVPMMATSSTMPADEAGWAFEIKWDGVRALSYVRNGALHMESRNLLDITPRYPETHGLAAALGGRDAIVDGEVVAFDETGRPSFQRLQRRMHVTGTSDVRRHVTDTPVMYVLFDVLWLDGESLMTLPYRDRRSVLEGLQLQGPSWQVPATHVGEGTALREATRAQRMEGIVAKRLDSTYEPGRRRRAWLKIKNVGRQEVVIGGWLPGEGRRAGGVGALIVGYYEGDSLRFAGKVGTGFTDKMLDEIGQALDRIAVDRSPFADKVPYKKARFVEPCLVGEVEFTEWTEGGTLRHPSFKGFRDDKPAAQVVREPGP